jgi:hypothetical protein
MLKCLLRYASEIWGYSIMLIRLNPYKLNSANNIVLFLQITASYFAIGKYGKLPFCTISMT